MVAAISRTSRRKRPLAADPLELVLLEHAQELRLRDRADVADFVEKERAAVGLLDAPRRLVGAGECALLVAEELGLGGECSGSAAQCAFTKPACCAASCDESRRR